MHLYTFENYVNSSQNTPMHSSISRRLVLYSLNRTDHLYLLVTCVNSSSKAPLSELLTIIPYKSTVVLLSFTSQEEVGIRQENCVITGNKTQKMNCNQSTPFEEKSIDSNAVDCCIFDFEKKGKTPLAVVATCI